MPQPTIVWLWRPGADRGLRGTLSLEKGALRFVGDEGERIRIPLEEVRRVRRQRITPVIELHYRREGEPRVALLFFSEPPSMPGRRTPTTGAARPARRRRRRIAGMMDLRRGNRRMKPVVREWAEAIGS